MSEDSSDRPSELHPTDETARLRVELALHGKELVMQNEQLRRSHIELQAARDRYAALYEQAPVGYLTLDPHGAILEVNARVGAFLGLTRDALIGTPLSRHVPRDQAAALGLHLRAVVACEPSSSYDLSVHGPAGVRRHARVESVYVPERDGTPAHVRMVIVDISSQREAEAAMREAQRTLERREEELLHLQRLEILGHLAARLAHEYRNIFGAMRWSVAAAEQDARLCSSGDCPTLSHFDRLRADVERANTLAAQVVALGRKQRPNLQPTRLDHVVEQMAGVLKSLLGGQGIEVAVEPLAGLAWIQAGQGWLEQAILNLAMNARDAMPAGGRLRVATRMAPGGVPPSPDGARLLRSSSDDAAPRPQADPSREAVALTVTDTGAGMFPETMARLFEPFFTTKKGQAGSGLGLSTVRDLVERMGGHIGVQSEPGHGSTFTVTLPLTDERPPSGAPAGSLPTPPPRPRTVLVVDDEPLILRSVEHFLRLAGHLPLVAGSARDARACLERHPGPIDLLLTDVLMPDATARELTELVRERHPHVAVLHMSANPREQLLADGLIDAAGVTIEKPFTEQELVARIAQVFERG